MAFVLDTNIVSSHMKRPGKTFTKFNQFRGRLFTAPVVVAEFYVWCFNSPDPLKRRVAVDDLLSEFEVLPFDNACAWQFAELRHQLASDNVADLMIAATALNNGMVLVTDDADFRKISAMAPRLRLVNWLRGSKRR